MHAVLHAEHGSVTTAVLKLCPYSLEVSFNLSTKCQELAQAFAFLTRERVLQIALNGWL
jgi:hypothetical protein